MISARRRQMIETRIKDKIENAISCKVTVSVYDNMVTVHTPEPNWLWDEIEMRNLFGEESNGWMSSCPEEGKVILDLNYMNL